MAILQPGTVQALEHSKARCCWCQQPLMRARQKDEWTPWWCFTPACYTRQCQWAVTANKVGAGVTWLFCPVPKQVEFFEEAHRLGKLALQDPERGSGRVLFGGSAGPGKSHALRWGLYRDAMRIPNLNCLLLRRTFKELDNTHLREMMREVPRLGGRYLAADKRAVWPNGSVIQAGHCETDQDAGNHLSTEYDREVFDELVTFAMGPALEIMSRARTSKEAVKAAGGAQVWAGSNPGGRGALWVKSFFVDKEVDPAQFPKYQPDRYGYVHAQLDDNPYMDPAYRQTLEEMPALRRRQLLEGDWNAFEGQFFDWLPSKDGAPWHVADLGVSA